MTKGHCIFIYTYLYIIKCKKENIVKIKIYPPANSKVHFSTPVIINLSNHVVRGIGQPKKEASGICKQKSHKNICRKQ